MSNERILVTGACGSVGGALVHRYLNKGAIVCCLDHDEDKIFRLQSQYREHKNFANLRFFIGSIRDKARLEMAFDGVDTVYHCAAMKHVHLSEVNSFEAVETNITGTYNVVKAALSCNVARVIFTSSDKAVNPTSTMGATKLVAERIISSANYYSGPNATKFATVRFGNVLNTNGSVVPIFRDQLAQGASLTITSEEMTRFFITMEDAVDLCVFAADNIIGGEIYVLHMRSANVRDLAVAINHGVVPDYKILGPKPGEKLYEELVTDVEAPRTFSSGSYVIVMPEDMDMLSLLKRSHFETLKADLNHSGDLVRSDSDLMNVDEIRQLLTRADREGKIK